MIVKFLDNGPLYLQDNDNYNCRNIVLLEDYISIMQLIHSSNTPPERVSEGYASLKAIKEIRLVIKVDEDRYIDLEPKDIPNRFLSLFINDKQGGFGYDAIL